MQQQYTLINQRRQKARIDVLKILENPSKLEVLYRFQGLEESYIMVQTSMPTGISRGVQAALTKNIGHSHAAARLRTS